MSSINPNNIDGTYPIAGQDNDSQGFRDNFTNIKNNFTFTKAEVEDIQNNAILKSALSGTTLNNNLNNAPLVGAQLLKSTETINDIGIQNGAVNISWQDGHFQLLETSGPITINVTGWSTSGFHNKLRLAIDVTNIAHTVTFGAGTYLGLDGIQGVVGNTITFTTPGMYYFELSTYDSGGTVAIEDVFRNYSTNDLTTSSGVIGYSTGAGVTVTQATNKGTAVTANGTTGTITTSAAALAANGRVSFVFNNARIGATDILLLQHQTGGTVGAYTLTANPGAGSATVYITNQSTGSLSQAIVIRFAVIKSVNS